MERLITVPNVLSALRLPGSLVLVLLAAGGRDGAFLVLFVVLALSDWVDGKLAILLDQRSDFGARLDSWADAALYAALLLGVVWLRGEALRSEWWWVVVALACYAVSNGAALWKYRRWPSYHTRVAKVSWFLVLVGAVCLLGGWTPWPMRLGLAGVAVANLEGLCITLVSPRWQADVSSVREVLRGRRRG